MKILALKKIYCWVTNSPVITLGHLLHKDLPPTEAIVGDCLLPDSNLVLPAISPLPQEGETAAES